MEKEQPILHLNLKEKWFGMIYSGEKKEEYRQIKPFWDRIFDFDGKINIKGKLYNPSEIIICFSNGYATDRPQMRFKCKGIEKRCGNQAWGAIEGEKYYVLLLGEKLNNIN